MKLYNYEEEHINIIRKLSPECMVLLKNDSVLPLEGPCDVGLYGSGARRTIKGGTGSGDVNVRDYVTIERGLKNAGFNITSDDWLNAYDQYHDEARKNFVEHIKGMAKEKGIPAVWLGMGAVMPEPEYDLPIEEEGDLAIYVLSRISGEGSDRKAVKGDLKLTDTEIKDIQHLNSNFKRFVLLLNVGGVIDLTPVQEVRCILLLSQTGMTIGDSLTDVILGKSYPSGKLTSTWARWEDYCDIGDFGEKDDTRYKEGIYVGYRYFDSTNTQPLYPFGYGMGYTEFVLDHRDIQAERTKITVRESVTNIGQFSGKEVVQVYVSIPGQVLDQPYQVLAGFAKTASLKPGETEEVVIEFDLSELSSYDEVSSCNILEAGQYLVRIGTSSKDTVVCANLNLKSLTVVKKLASVGGAPDFVDWKPEQQEEYANYKLPEGVKCIEIDASNIGEEEKKNDSVADTQILERVKEMSDSELVKFCLGAYKEEGNESVIGSSAMTVAGAGGETCHLFKESGIPVMVMADGPAGLRLSKQFGVDDKGIYTVGEVIPAAMAEFVDDALMATFGISKDAKVERKGEVYDQYCSAIPIGTALAQTWNLNLCKRMGELVGREMRIFGVHIWLAPALNIHRSPLCGRNFEYFSEDPYISGRIAAAITRGVQSHPGCAVTVKHFACNNQETNRFRSNSIVSQRALRDIYLKGFEIAVKESQPHAIMTSYNLLNGIHTSERSDLNNTVLRDEWNFEGIIMSDWVVPGLNLKVKHKYLMACASGSIRAGNDIMMPGSAMDYEEVMGVIKETANEDSLTREVLETSAYRIMVMAAKLGRVYTRIEKQ